MDVLDSETRKLRRAQKKRDRERQRYYNNPDRVATVVKRAALGATTDTSPAQLARGLGRPRKTSLYKPPFSLTEEVFEHSLLHLFTMVGDLSLLLCRYHYLSLP